LSRIKAIDAPPGEIATLAEVDVRAAALAMAVWISSAAVAAEPPAVAAGRFVATRECGTCHAVGPRGASPFPDAPPLRTVRGRMSRLAFLELLESRLETAHPRMPSLDLGPDEVANLMAWWDSLPAGPQSSR
jgi:mono/diheme cytochrome c family protein